MKEFVKTKIRFLDESDEPRISRLAILSLLLGIFSLLFFVLAGIPAIVIGILSILIIRSSAGEIRGRYIALAGISISILFMFLFCLLWSIDAPPIPNDYTIEDLQSAPPEYAESFEVLKILLNEDYNVPGAPAIGLKEEDIEKSTEIYIVIQKGDSEEITNIVERYAKDIERIWANMRQARDVIKRLNTFAEIADLTELNDNLEFMRDQNLIKLARFYQVYVHLKIEQNDIQACVDELVELDSVCRKLSVNARMLIPKLTYLVCINVNILTANAIVNDQQIQKSNLELMSEYFIPLTDEQTSLRNCVLSEYLLMKSMLSEMSKLIASEKILPLKMNSAHRMLRNSYDKWLDVENGRQNITNAKFSVWPDIYPFKEPSVSSTNMEQIPLLYRCYNPHINIFNVFTPFGKSIKSKKELITQFHIHDDLFRIVLNKRIGKKISLKARAYSDEYIIDVDNRKILSPGADGKTDTKDDIFLRINPEVLGWEN